MVKKYNMLRVQSVGFWIQSCQVIGKARRLFREKFNRNDFHLVTTTEDDLSIEELAKWRTAKTRKKKMIKMDYQRIKQKIIDLCWD